MLKNLHGLKLIKGVWYMCKANNFPATPYRYTDSTEDAYYVHYLFSDECNLTIENKMEIIPNEN